MIYVIAQLKLESYDKWKPLFNERSAMRKENGAKEANLFRNSDDPNEVVILFKWDNKENAKKYVESATLLEALQKAGIKKLKVTYLDEVAKTI